MSPQIWTEFFRRFVSRGRRRVREDEFYANIVREEQERVRNDPDQIMNGAELEAARTEVLR